MQIKFAEAKHTYNRDVAKSNAIILSKPPQVDNSVNPRWTIKDLQGIMKSLKQMTDGAIPTTNPLLFVMHYRFDAKDFTRIGFVTYYEDLVSIL